MGFALDLESLIDCQFKRINEHRRQFMNALYLIHRYFQDKDASPGERARIPKRTE